MGLFNKTKPIIIKNEAGNDVLFWRSPVETLDKKSQVLVRATDVALFEKNGELLELKEGGLYPVFNKNSIFSDFLNTKEKEVSIDLIYMSKTAKLIVRWGSLKQLDLIDPKYNVPLKVGAHGEYEVQINNPRKFYLELVGREDNFSIDDLRKRLQSRILSFIEPEVDKYMKKEKETYLNISAQKAGIQENIYNSIRKFFADEYGLKIFSFTLSNIFLNQESEEKLIKVASEFIEEIEETKEVEATVETEVIEDTNTIEETKEDLEKEPDISEEEDKKEIIDNLN